MKLALALGTRPEIVKLAPIMRAAAATRGVDMTVVHTGQHYSWELDGVFFQELGLPQPDVFLRVGSGSHAHHLSRIIAGIEPYLATARPDAVVVQGDTNSVLAVALAARTLQIPVAHVEAGLRSYDRSMPEEMNRVLVDHVADRCFAPTELARRTLLGEGVDSDRVLVTGNTAVDEILRQRERAEALDEPGRMGLAVGRYALATVHRAENTASAARLRGIFEGLERVGRRLGMPVIAVLHPRTVAALQREHVAVGDPVRVVPSIGYLRFLSLHAGAAITLTDSGGLQEEACTLGVPCVTLRNSTERPESIEVGANVLAGSDPDAIVEGALAMAGRARSWINPFGDGHSGERIVAALAAEPYTELVPDVAIRHRSHVAELEHVRRHAVPTVARAAHARGPRRPRVGGTSLGGHAPAPQPIDQRGGRT